MTTISKQPAPIPFVSGNVAKLFVADNDTYQEALRLIRSATTSIQFESFTFNAEMGRGIAQALIDARRRGVNVHVVLDHKSMHMHGQGELAKWMLRNGVDVHRYSEKHLRDPLVAIDHAKNLVVDGKTALVGGTNFDRNINYDLNYRLQGPAVRQAQAKFEESWKNSKRFGRLIVPASLPQVRPVPRASAAPVPGGNTDVYISETAPRAGKATKQTFNHIVDQIKAANESIDVLMYNMSDVNEIRALQDAHANGRRVRVVLNENHAYNLKAAKELQDSGIEVRWFKKPLGIDEMHAKVAIFDGKTVLGGSTNWVHSSSVDNHELGVWLKGPVSGQVDSLYDQIWRTSTKDIPKFSMADQVKAGLMKAVSRFL
jgi:phosphatidylserine/phosphatidylglycerophosphate/cardiolipin synthase-like enzyme